MFSQAPPKASRYRVRDWLREAGIYSCWAARKPLLSTTNIRKRLDFAKKMSGYDWSRVVFSDEKIWRIRPVNEHVRVWRRRGDRYDAKYTAKSVAKSLGVMVWCAINSKGQIVFKRCPETLNAAGYQDLLGDVLHFIRPSRFVFFGFSSSYTVSLHRATKKQVIFQQDNAPPHTAMTTKDWFKKNGVKVMQWPPQSPDINIVEHIWPEVTRSLTKTIFNTQDELWEALEEGFKSVQPDYIKTLYGSMTRRLSAVLVANGAHTKY